MASFDPFGGGGIAPPAFGGPRYGANAYTDVPNNLIPGLNILPTFPTSGGTIQPPGSYQPPQQPNQQPQNGNDAGVMDGLTKWLKDPKNIIGLAGLVTALVGGSRGGGNGQASAESQRLNQITEEKVRRADPLHQAVTQLAWNRLPTNARQGITAPTYKPLS